MTVRERLKTIVMDILTEPGVEFSDELSMENCGAWDSVATVQIVLAVGTRIRRAIHHQRSRGGT